MMLFLFYYFITNYYYILFIYLFILYLFTLKLSFNFWIRFIIQLSSLIFQLEIIVLIFKISDFSHSLLNPILSSKIKSGGVVRSLVSNKKVTEIVSIILFIKIFEYEYRYEHKHR